MEDAGPSGAAAEEEQQQQQQQQQQRDNGGAGADADADAAELQRADTRARLESSCSSPGAPGAGGNGRGDDGGGAERRGGGSPGEKRPRAEVMEDIDDEDEVTSGSRAMGGRPGNEGACSSSGAGSATSPQAALESLPSRRAQTVPAQVKYEPSRTAQERAKLKKVYSFVNVDTINLQMGAVPAPSRCATGAGAEGDPESAGGSPRPQAQSAGADHAGGASSELSSDDEGGPNSLPASARRPRDGGRAPELNNGSASPSDSSSAPSTPKDGRGREGSGDRTKRSLSLFASFRPGAGAERAEGTQQSRRRGASTPTWDEEDAPGARPRAGPSPRVSGLKSPRRRSSILQLRNLKALIASRENMKTSLMSMRKRRHRLARGAMSSGLKSNAGAVKTCEFIRENFGKIVVCTPVYENEDDGGRARAQSVSGAEGLLGAQESERREGGASSPAIDEMERRRRRASSGTLMGAAPPRPSLTEQSCGINDIIEGKNRNASDFSQTLSRMKAKIQIKTPTFINGLIHPECELKITWDLFVGVGVLYTLVIVPYQLSFLTTEDDVGLLIFNVLCDVIFAIDIIVKMNTAWRDRKGDLITEKKTVVTEYVFRGLFVVDVISCIPIDLMIYLAVSGGDDDEYRTLRYLKLLRLARLARLINCFKIANINLVLESFGKISMNLAMGRLFQFIIGFLSVTHVMACLWWAVGDRNNVSWWSGDAHSWAVDFADESSSYKYLVSLYWAMGTMSGVGYGDVIPQNSHERLFGIFAELVGVFAFGLVVGYVSTLVESVSYRNSVHRERHLKMSTYIKQRNLPGNLQKRLNEHVKWSVRNQVRAGRGNAGAPSLILFASHDKC